MDIMTFYAHIYIYKNAGGQYRYACNVYIPSPIKIFSYYFYIKVYFFSIFKYTLILFKDGF